MRTTRLCLTLLPYGLYKVTVSVTVKGSSWTGAFQLARASSCPRWADCPQPAPVDGIKERSETGGDIGIEAAAQRQQSGWTASQKAKEDPVQHNQEDALRCVRVQRGSEAPAWREAWVCAVRVDAKNTSCRKTSRKAILAQRRKACLPRSAGAC